MVETSVYVKMIKEDIGEIKQSIKELKTEPKIENDSNSKMWQLIMVELIKLAGLCVMILGAIVGAIKILGK